MSLTEKIFALEAKIADLEQQLTSQISEQNEQDIRQQLIENTKLLNTYNQSAPAGKKYSNYNINRIPTNSVHNKDNHSYHVLDTYTALNISNFNLIFDY